VKSKPYVGQIVYLNNEGMDMIGGLRNKDDIKASKNMKIIFVGDEVIPDIWEIDVDGKFNKFLLTSDDVDVI
jgi:hypothetical protein